VTLHDGAGMTRVSRLILWRHGNTDFNASDRVQGQLDVPLNARGRGQAVAAAAKLAGFSPEAIFSSDLSRAADTAAALAALTGLPVSYDPRLRERYFGDWQGLTMSEAAERYPAEYARWRAGEPDIGCGIETVDDMAKRVGAALREIAEAVPDGTAIVATHGGAARHGCGDLLGWPSQVTRSLGALDNCHWTDLRPDLVRGWRLRAHNVGI
jgi:probable phosphoglycerate mutase